MLPEDAPSRWNVDLDPLAIGLGMAEQITSAYVDPGSHRHPAALLGALIPDVESACVPRERRSAPKLFIDATTD